ncbi:MAG: arginase family protein [Candidatus Hodarchaeota archaeon]
MKINLIQVPYDLGKKAQGMGLGPIRFMETNIVQKLQDFGHKLKVGTIHLEKPFRDEISAIVDLNTLLKKVIQDGVKAGYFPLILGGNCNTCLGTLAGLNDPETGIIWFDAHGDFNTPETSPSGFFDGMPFAIATGQCHTDLWSQIADINPIKESHSLHIGGRDFDLEEQELLEKSRVGVIKSIDLKRKEFKNKLLPVLTDLQSKTEKIYLHIDIDIVDPQEAPGVDFQSPNGLTSEEVEVIIKMICERFVIKAAALTAYNPTKDEDNKTLNVGIHLLNAIVREITRANKLK